MSKRAVICASVAILFAGAASAADLKISDAWFRALPGGLPAGGYFSMKNSGPTSVVLVSAATPACGMLMLHRTLSANGVSKMVAVERVMVPAGGTVAFAPGGYHLMCTQPGAAMTPGKTVPVTLIFSDGSKMQADFTVKNAAGE